jgi:putative membrane protein insertion efficiency factor
MLMQAWRWRAGLAQRLLMLLVRGYRFWFKPWLGNTCRFEPSCSAYALQALRLHGAARGAALAGWRLLRCHPWCEGGCDDVPDVWTLPWSTITAQPEPTHRGLFTALGSMDASAAPADAVPTNRKST